MTVKSIAANQTELHFHSTGSIVFFSYETPVACFVPGKGIYRTEKKWSATTTRHINKFIERTNPASTVTLVPQNVVDSFVPSDFEI